MLVAEGLVTGDMLAREDELDSVPERTDHVLHAARRDLPRTF